MFIEKFEVARRTVNKKATTVIQPTVECAEKSLNNVTVDLGEKIGCSDSVAISESTTAVTTTEIHSQCTHDSHSVSGIHNVSTNANVPSHLLAHYNYQNAINPDELRGMIAGMAAMAAQSNAVCLLFFYKLDRDKFDKSIFKLLESRNIFKSYEKLNQMFHYCQL